MIELQTATAYNYESLFTANTNPDPASQPLSNFKFLPYTGTIGAPSAKYGYDPTKIKGVMHSHYAGLLSVYSVDDLQDIYLQLVNPTVTDDFFSALVTKSGTRYLLSIADKSKFIAFGNKYLSTDVKKRDLSKLYISKYNITTSTTNEGNERGFMKMMTELNIGLNTFSGNANFTEWRKLSYSNNTNTVTSSGCD